jgi:hypothetical protein
MIDIAFFLLTSLLWGVTAVLVWAFTRLDQPAKGRP